MCFVFCLVLLFWFCFWFRIVSFPSLHTKAVEFFQVSVEGHWTYSWTYVLERRVSLRLFNLDCRYPRDLLQPARKKKTSKRPAPEGASSSSRQASPPPSDSQPDPPTFWDFGPPLTMFSGDPDRPPIGAHPHPYRRTSSSLAGKNTGKGKGTPTLTHADIANKRKKGQKGGKGQKGHKGPKGHKGDKGGKGPKGDAPTPVLHGGKDTPKGGKK